METNIDKQTDVSRSGQPVILLFTSFMHSPTPLRVLRARTSKQVASRRLASHGAPHYNEPSGYLFGEKVKTSVAMLSI